MTVADCFQKRLLARAPPDASYARRSLELSRNNLESARKNLEICEYRTAIVLSYTAMFHAARAILYIDGIKERSHECIPIYLRERYPELKLEAGALDSYRKYRHEAIYGLEFDAGAMDGTTALSVAAGFVAVVEKKLADRLG
jgi:uncharacterized protein (UPF0332 family)